MPGQRLIEARLADTLGVSRAPLREAIKLLEFEGLITRLPRRGIIVSVLSHKDVEEIYELRLALESWAIREVCYHLQPADLRAFDAIIEEMASAAAAGDIEGLSKDDVAFHRTLCHLAGNERLLRVWHSNLGQLRLLSNQSTEAMKPNLTDLVSRHQAIRDAIAFGDVDAAQRVLREHIESAAERTLRRQMYRNDGTGSRTSGAAQ